MAKHSELASVTELDERLKRLDEVRWLASRYAEPAARRRLVAVGLLGAEVRRAMGMSEPMLGRIRVQWWREAIEALVAGGPVRRHDLVEELAEAFANSSSACESALRWLDAVDGVLDDHLASGGHGADAAHADRHVAAEAGLLGFACEAAIPGSAMAQAEATHACAAGWVARVASTKDAEESWRRARAAFASLPPDLTPALAHLAAANLSPEEKPLAVRWRIFRAVLFKRLP